MSQTQVLSLDQPPEITAEVTGALIDGSITYSSNLIESAQMAFTLPTPTGESPPFYLVEHGGVKFWYVHFHGVDFTTASKNVQVGFTGTWYLLHLMNVRDVISGAAVGSIHPEMRPGDVVVMDDFIDFSTHRPRSMLTEIWEKPPWIGAQFDTPLCPELTDILRQELQSYSLGRVFKAGTLGQFEGHRFESPGEIRMAQSVGADMVAHHQASEAIYARELGIHYGAINYVTNIAAGLSELEDPFVSDDQAKAGYKSCTEIMLSAMVRAAGRDPDCQICPQDEDQPIERKKEDVLLKPVYR
jgi:5'-methylthioadenosine phosphorylase